MKISIITPVYNAQNTIERTILSVINQQLNSDLEYIIIDGNSQDKTLEIVNKYSERINVIISEKDQGTYDAMNKGIKLASGDIIGIINADDWYNDGALQIVEQAFTKYQDIAIVHSPVKNYLEGKYLSTFMPGDLKKMVFKLTVAHPSCFVKKQVYEQVGLFDLSYSMAADYDFILRAYTSGAKFHCVETPLASFSLNGMTGKVTNRLKLIQESWRVGAKVAGKTSKNLEVQHRVFYTKWMMRELATLPLKFFDPYIAIKVKGFVRQKIGKLASDEYGAW